MPGSYEAAHDDHPGVFAKTDPDRVAFIDASTGETTRYRDLEARSNQIAHMFRDWGLRPGDGILIQCENSGTYLELIWGAYRAGLYYTPVSWHLTADEVCYIAHDSQARVYFASHKYKTTALGVVADLPGLRAISIGGEIPGFERLESHRSAYPESPIADETSGSDMLYTSGTTGRPKGVKFPLSGEAIAKPTATDIQFNMQGYDHRCVALSPGPMYHPSALYTAMATQRFGGQLVIDEKFDAERTLALIERHKVTHMICVPTHFIRMLKLPKDTRDGFDVSSLACVLHTAAPCPAEVKRAMIKWFGPIITEFYGGTEKVGGTVITSDEWLQHPGSIGKPVTGAAHVLDEATWAELPVGDTGVIYFEAGQSFDYHGDDAKTKSIQSPQGWRTLGDIGHVDEDGYVYLTDRKSNMIISGGVNIYPQEAEDRLLSHPDVMDAAVFGIPNVEFGEEVKAVVQLAASASPGPEMEQDLIAHCKRTLASLKCPRSIDFATQLPRYDNGKLYKRKLVEQYRNSGEAG